MSKCKNWHLILISRNHRNSYVRYNLDTGQDAFAFKLFCSPLLNLKARAEDADVKDAGLDPAEDEQRRCGESDPGTPTGISSPIASL